MSDTKAKLQALILLLEERVVKYIAGINNHEGNSVYLKAKLVETEDILKRLKEII